MAPMLSTIGLGKQFNYRSGPRSLIWSLSKANNRPKSEKFWALRDINFSVERGEMLGVIGHNGSGKTTLLRLLGGVFRPDEGEIVAQAPVNGLIDPGTGMHPDLTGRENVEIMGVLLGLLRSEVDARFDDIVKFSELETVIDEPVRTYSSGMQLRLGFAVAAHVDPEILVIDEVLAVGDLAFQEKCFQKISAIRKSGAAIVLISHDMRQIETTCDRAMCLSGGRIIAEGSPSDTVGAYRTALRHSAGPRKPTSEVLDATSNREELVLGQNRTGDQSVILSDLILRDADGYEGWKFASGGQMSVEASAKRSANSDVTKAHFSVSIHTQDGYRIFDINTAMDRMHVALKGEEVKVSLKLERLDLAPGRYRISAGLWAMDWSHPYDFHTEAYLLEVTGEGVFQAPLAPPRRWNISAQE